MTTTSRSARYAKWLSIPLGLAISALLIWQASYAAFTDSVTSPGNVWTAGSVTFEEDDEIRALFREELLTPGATRQETVSVTYSGSLDADVSFFGENYEQTNGLGDHIWLTIEGSEGDEIDDNAKGTIFNGTLTTLSTSTHLTHPVVGGVERTGTFRFTFKLADDAPQSVQGGTAKIDFVLKSQSRSS